MQTHSLDRSFRWEDGPLPTPCKIWTGSYSSQGRAKLGDQYVSRRWWERARGPILGGLKVLHHCDNGGCYADAHLYLGTLSQNAQDMYRRNRRVVKLTHEQREEIRQKAGTGVGPKTLALEYGITPTAVWYIRYGYRKGRGAYAS